MIDNKYSKAYKEVLEIIKYFPENEYNKIPKEKIDFFKEHMDEEYNFSINPAIELSKQNISKETNALIVTLFQDYFATEEQKEKIKEILDLNEIKAEQDKREKFNPDDLFKNTNINTTDNHENITEETALAEYKETFFIKFKNFILKLLHIKN